MRAKILLLLLLVLIGLSLDQVLQFTVLSDGRFRGTPVAPYDPPLFNDAQRESLERLRRQVAGEPLAWRNNAVFDAELGWSPEPGSSRGDCSYDRFGARIHDTKARPPAHEKEHHLVVVGGSFTHCDEVAHGDSWPAILDESLAEVRVSNLGFGAYGVDQALLRYRRDGTPLQPDEVWLGLMPQAVLRVVTTYRPALRHHDLSVSFKPRLELLDDGDLVLLKNPASSVARTVQLLSDQAAFFEAVRESDLWVARAASAYRPQGSHWSHYFATARLLLTFVERKRRDPAPWLQDQESEVFRLMRAIVLALAAECERGSARFRVVLLPDGKSLASLREQGSAYWQGLLDRLLQDGVEVVDLTGVFAENRVELDAAGWQPGGHYSGKTNRLVASELAKLFGE